MRRKQISLISQFFTCEHKINESNALLTHYWIACLYSKNVSFYVFISNKFFNFFRNMFNTKIIILMYTFIMSFIFSFEIIKVAVPEPCFFFWIPAWIAGAAAVIPNGAKTFFSLMDQLLYSIMILKILQI